jgi:putative ATP-binding cassette transporter
MSLQRIFHFENNMKNLAEEKAKGNAAEYFNKIEYKDISFVYDTKDSSPFGIGPMSITFQAGEVVFITGGNGSGKSTLLNTITGLYPLVSGQIAVNDKDTDIQSQRELFSPIFTDFHLFDRLYGMKNVDEEKLADLLKLFKLEKKVEWIDGKFSTLDLSTGQKKRLAMLVTMMEDKPVYVFDEWAADQDPHFREYFYMTLLPTFKKQGKTVIAVTHDDRYFETADRVLYLEYGQLREEV